jgi:hypothetical protein
LPKFKVGDRVRIKNNAEFSRGSKGIITGIGKTVYLVLRDGSEDSGMMFFENELELIEEKPKPWLKVTPPQPEKRELQSFWLNSETHIIFKKAANGEDIIEIGTMGIHKKMLDELIETLVEISKEMKNAQA